nr:hypothetical protein [bacterium]
MANKKKWDASHIIGVCLFVTLVISLVFVVIRLIQAPEHMPEGEEFVRVKSDYRLMVLQCVLGIAVMFIPTLLDRKFNIRFPNYIDILYYLFLYGAVFLGEIRHFYYVVPHWDDFLHSFSGAMLGALGFSLVSVLNSSDKVHVHLSPAFIAIFSFCFAEAVGVVWELYEYTMDGIMGLNMQKYALEYGEALIGREALKDTMTDLTVSTIGALVVVTIGYIIIRKRKDDLPALPGLMITRKREGAVGVQGQQNTAPDTALLDGAKSAGGETECRAHQETSAPPEQEQP